MFRLKSGGSALIRLFLAVLISQQADSATYRRLSLDDLAQNSEIVVYGRVIECHAEWDPATRSIWTRTDIMVLDGPKGRPGPTLSFTEPGGILGAKGELYPGVPQFRRSQEVILFLYRAPGNRLRITGLLQGVYTVSTDPTTGERVVAPAAPRSELVQEEQSHRASARDSRNGGKERLSRFLDSIRQRATSR